MTHATIIGIDLAKNVFHAHGATHDGTPIFRKKLSRNQVLPFLSEQPHCLVAMEACAVVSRMLWKFSGSALRHVKARSFRRQGQGPSARWAETGSPSH